MVNRHYNEKVCNVWGNKAAETSGTMAEPRQADSSWQCTSEHCLVSAEICGCQMHDCGSLFYWLALVGGLLFPLVFENWRAATRKSFSRCPWPLYTRFQNVSASRSPWSGRRAGPTAWSQKGTTWKLKQRPLTKQAYYFVINSIHNQKFGDS